jgi:DNA-binding Xre family transcriptional regulator
MIYIDFEGLLEVLSVKSERKATISEVAKETGITRKALSWLKNHPTDSIGSEHLGTLCEYFYHKLHPYLLPNRNPAVLMHWIVSSLIEVYPDHPDYKCEFEMYEGFVSTPTPHSLISPRWLWGIYIGQKKLDVKPLKHEGGESVYSYLFGEEFKTEHRRHLEKKKK